MNEYIKTKETYFLFSKPFCFQEKASPNSHPPPILGFVMRAWLREPSAAISEGTKPSCSQATIRHLTRWLNYGNMLLGILIQLRTVATPPCLLFTILNTSQKRIILPVLVFRYSLHSLSREMGRPSRNTKCGCPRCLLRLHLGADAGCPRLELGSNRWHRGHHLPVSFWQSLSNFIWETLLLSATPGDISHIFVTARLQAALAPFKCNDSIQIFSHHIKYFLLGRRLADGGLLDRWVMLRVRYLTQLSVHGSPWPAALRPPR